jgi:uncharacterized protein YbaA (DUF1428 family)
MPRYADGYVLPVPTKHVAHYRRIARQAGKVWMDHGALQYCEAVGDDLDVKWGVPFPQRFRAKPGETIVFSWIVFKSRAHRDRVNAKVMKDPRMTSPPAPMPFDSKRMVFGGFELIVDL